MNIPYTTDRRPDTGVSNGTLGIWLFLASEVMLFGALFSSYALLRVSAPSWPAGSDLLSVWLGSLNTVLLLTMTAIVWRARALPAARIRPLFLLGTGLAVAFLAVKSIEYTGEYQLGLRPSLSTFLATYFTLTGLHALHVICGVVANLWIVAGSRKVGDAMTLGRVKAVTLYWAFVDVVWIVIFVLMYLT